MKRPKNRFPDDSVHVVGSASRARLGNSGAETGPFEADVTDLYNDFFAIRPWVLRSVT
jgi:hypothetical protein